MHFPTITLESAKFLFDELPKILSKFRNGYTSECKFLSGCLSFSMYVMVRDIYITYIADILCVCISQIVP